MNGKLTVNKLQLSLSGILNREKAVKDQKASGTSRQEILQHACWPGIMRTCTFKQGIYVLASVLLKMIFIFLIGTFLFRTFPDDKFIA